MTNEDRHPRLLSTETQRDSALLRSLVDMDSNIPQLPEKFEVPNDEMGLVRHERLHEVAARNIFFTAGLITKIMATSHPEVAAQLAAEPRDGRHVIDLPIMTLAHNQFGIRRIVTYDEGTVHRTSYELFRSDIGNPEGGCFITHNHDGTTIVTRKLDDNESTDPSVNSRLIHQADRLLNVYAEKHSISTALLQPIFHDDQFDEAAQQAIIEKYKRSQQLSYKIGKQVLDTTVMTGHHIKNGIRKLITTNKQSGNRSEIMPFGERRLSPARIAVAALLMPIPGVSTTIANSPIPRPGSIELAAIGADWVIPDPKPDFAKIYEDKELDLPDATHMVTDGQYQPLVFISEGSVDLAQAPNTDINDNTRDMLPKAHSPHRIRILNSISPNSCLRLGVNSELFDRQYYLGTADPENAHNITYKAGKDAIYICNDQKDKTIASNQISLYFDTRG